MGGTGMSDTRLLTNSGVHRFTRMIGRTVDHVSGLHLGTLEDLLIDLGESRVLAAVLKLAAPAGVQNPLIAVPLGVLGFDPAEEKILLNVDERTLAHAPAFEAAEGSPFPDRAWAADLYAYYHCVPYWQP
jgi:PRC-barrel domain